MRTVAFVVTGPPTADIGAFVEVVDDEGMKVEVGWWERRGANWAYVMPVELVPRLIVPPPAEAEKTYQYQYRTRDGLGVVDPLADEGQRAMSALDARAALKERVRNARKKEVAPVTVTSTDIPAHWPACPGCQSRFDPAKDELLDCGNCGESRSTACCLPDPVRPCADCDALAAAGEEQGLVDESAAPPAGRLFDGKFHPDPRKAAQAAAAGDDVQDDDDGDEEGDE